MQRLQRIDQHAGDVAPTLQDTQRPFRHLGQRIGLVRRDRVADAGLHVAPPAVIGAGEANQMRTPGVVTGEPHRLHDGFGAGHVERDLVESGNRTQPGDVVDDDGVVGSEHRAERMRAGFGVGDAFLVEVVAEDVDAVGAGQVVEHIAVEIGHGDARGGLYEGAGAEMLAHQPRILERHPIGFGELQVGDPFRRLQGQRPALGKPLAVETGEPEETVLALRGDLGRRAVGTEEVVDVELVERDQPRHQARHLGVPAQRAVLGPRQRQPRAQSGNGGGGAGNRGRGERQNRKVRIHVVNRYPVELTDS